MNKYRLIGLVFGFFVLDAICHESFALQNEIKDQEGIIKWPRTDSSKQEYALLPAENSDEETVASSNNNNFRDNIEFGENKSRNIKTAESNQRPNVYFTKSQTREHVAIHYPNVPSNPHNRLQLDPEDAATLSSVIGTTTSKPSFNFFTDIGNKAKVPLINSTKKGVIKSMDITFDIVKSSSWGDQNVIFSPLSVCNILALLFLGSEGRTYDELANVLHIKNSDKSLDSQAKDFHQSFQRLKGYLNQRSGKDVSLELANEIFADKKFKLENEYAEQLNEYYETPINSFNFGVDGKLFKDQVNKWVQEKTNGKIKTIVDDPPSPDTTLAFVNAIYFKGNWETPFYDKITRSTPFYVNETETMNVQMMTTVLTTPYFENDIFQMVAIPYKGNRTGLFVIVPRASGIDGLKALERRVTILERKDLENRLKQMTLQKVAVKIPKLKITTDGHMKEILTNMGIPSMFQPNLANFSKISHNDGLFVSAVHHRAYIEINERGTEAAAVTLGTGDRTIEEELPIPVIANKPFMFFIYHIHAKTVLFWGRVTRPEWT